MKKHAWIIAIIIVALMVGIWSFKRSSQQTRSNEEVSGSMTGNKSREGNYWTCPMHPQIHQEHAGECPICHMKLVQVKVQEAVVSESVGSPIQASANQLALIGVQKTQVEQMDLNVSIPVAGRFVSGSIVAFQLYESDLAFIRPGLPFKGYSSFVHSGEIRGTISSVDSIVDPTSRTIRTLGRIDKSAGELIPETTFSGIVEVPLKNRVAIPESSVLHTGTGDLVYVFSEGNKLSARKVRLGQKTEGFFEVISGLEPGEVISSGPNFLIDSEAKIRGTSGQQDSSGKATTPECSNGEQWDIPMAMCMPGKPSK